MKTIAILYICTGKYDVFWQDFYKTSEHFFCVENKKHYFVFTDSKNIQSSNNVTVIYQDSLGWPLNTMYRYHMFLRIKQQLKQFDNIVFFNGNSLFSTYVTFNEFFGVDKSIVAAQHPGFYNEPIAKYTLETRINSSAYVSKRHIYAQGVVNGGKSHVFLAICSELAKNIDIDLQNGIVAIWHDESHWNAYLNNHYEQIQSELQLLNPAYSYPENWELPFIPKIILRDKNKHGGHSLLRGLTPKKNKNTKLKTIIKKLLGR